MRTRFAPSPTGHLHLGHVFAALFARDLAEAQHGEFLLRFEDIDITRVRADFYQEIESDLQWLGIPWSGEALRQTSRTSAYAQALKKLQDLELVYPCFCTRKQIETELAHITNAPHGPEGTHYPGICKSLEASEITTRVANGEIPSWRFDSQLAKKKYPNLSFHDHFHGEVKVQPDLLGDLILARKDIGTSYHVAVVVDDGFQNITDVTRGEDLIHSTHIHRVLQQALELPQPVYHHHPLILDDRGERLAKRHDSLSIKSLRESGHSADEVLHLITNNQ